MTAKTTKMQHKGATAAGMIQYLNPEDAEEGPEDGGGGNEEDEPGDWSGVKRG